MILVPRNFDDSHDFLVLLVVEGVHEDYPGQDLERKTIMNNLKSYKSRLRFEDDPLKAF